MFTSLEKFTQRTYLGIGCYHALVLRLNVVLICGYCVLIYTSGRLADGER